MTTHRYILSGGHRNTNRGGATGEVHWTYGATVRLRDAIVRRGGKAWIIQEQDGDSDRTDYLNGGLQQAAVHCTKLAPSLGPFDAYISMHYNGGASPGFHAIFPDAPTGGVDVKANNPLDVKLCRTVRDKVGEGRVICAQVPSRAVRVALTPAERQSLAPPPGCISRLWMAIPVGIFAIGRQLPTLGSAVGPLVTVMPAFRPSGAMM